MEDPAQAEEIVSSLPLFNLCRMSLHRTRKTNEPVLPKQRSDIHIPENLRTLPDGRDFLQANEGAEDKILLFATDQSLTRACSAETVLVDGTFYTCPRLFHQLFTFHIEEEGTVYPVIFALLPDKTRRTYERVFQMVKQRARFLGLQFQPPKLQTDYEQAIISAVRCEFPGSRLVGCMFHYGQCLWRKVQSLGGAEEYTAEAETRQYIRRCAALAFVPLQRLDDAWLEIQGDAPDTRLCTAFSDYFVNTWLDDVCSRFPRAMWNHHDNMKMDSIRTNNSLESWHRQLKGTVSCAHPNVFKIIRELQKQQIKVEQELRARRQGQQTRRPPRTAVRRKNERLERIKTSFESNEKTLREFVEACSYAVHM
jgi:hypothetical protein